MKSCTLDKIASVTQGCGLKRQARLGAEIPCEEGVVVAVQVLNEKNTYNGIELVGGRFARVEQGDVVAGALGFRNALFGYAGHLPENLVPGDEVHLLNQGGVIGLVDTINPDLGPPFRCRVLGTVLHFPVLAERIGIPARIGTEKLDLQASLRTRDIPVVALAGTCMQAGKTGAACTLIRRFTAGGRTVAAGKVTGVALRRDILAMEDAGAGETAIFTDLGIASTTARNAPAIARAIISRLAAHNPALILIELGDGLLGAYGVEAILADREIKSALSALVLAANDPVAAWGGVRILRETYGLEPAAVTGPATDNEVGSRIIREQLGLPAFNARTAGPALADVVLQKLEMS